MELAEVRRRSGMSQYLCAQSSGISRMRLSLAEQGADPVDPSGRISGAAGS